MNLFVFTRFAITASTLVAFAGCAGGGGSQTAIPSAQNVPPQALVRNNEAVASNVSNGFMQSVNAQSELVYMSSWGTLSVIDVFTSNGKQIGQIINDLQNGAPQGLFVDPNGNLLVANTGEFSNVLIYRRGALSSSRKLTDPIGGPVDVTVCPDGTTYVANGGNVKDGNTASIQVYPPGSTNPTRSLTYAHDMRNPFLACDAAGNVFVTIDTQLSSGNGRVIEFPGGQKTGAKDLGITLQRPGGIKVNKAGNLLVSDLLAQTISEYTEAGVATGHSIKTGSTIEGIAVSSDGRFVIGASTDLNEGIAWSFPAGNQETTFSPSRISPPFQVNEGVAIDPGQKAF